MNDRTSRMEHAQREVAAAIARVDELAALVPEPVGSVADAIRSFTPAQREAIWAHRTEAMQLVAQETAELQAELDRLTMKSRELAAEFEGLQSSVQSVFSDARSTARLVPFAHAPAWFDTSFERMCEIAEWSEQHEEEVGQLKTMIRELEALYAELEANPVAPSAEGSG